MSYPTVARAATRALGVWMADWNSFSSQSRRENTFESVGEMFWTWASVRADMHTSRVRGRRGCRFPWPSLLESSMMSFGFGSDGAE